MTLVTYRTVFWTYKFIVSMKLLWANVTLYTRVILQNLNTFKQFATFKF